MREGAAQLVKHLGAGAAFGGGEVLNRADHRLGLRTASADHSGLFGVRNGRASVHANHHLPKLAMTPNDVNPCSEKIMRKQEARCLFPIQWERPGGASNAPGLPGFR